MTKRTLYIHSGIPRTATTSIQEFMHKNSRKLMRKGILYPFGVSRHKKVMDELLNGTLSAREFANSVSMQEDQKKHDPKSIVLSDEGISKRKDLSILRGLQDYFDVKILMFMRRQDLWMESWYFQNIKWQWNPNLSHCTFEEFLEKRGKFHWLHYDKRLDMMATVFGREAVRPIVFEKKQMPNGPIFTFAQEIDLPGLDSLNALPHLNASMSAEIMEFIRHLPLSRFKASERKIILRSLEEVDREILGNTSRQSGYLMPPEQRHDIIAEFENGNARVARSWLGKEELFEDPIPGHDAPLAHLALPENSAILMRDFVVPFFNSLAEGDVIRPQKEDHTRDGTHLLSSLTRKLRSKRRFRMWSKYLFSSQ